MSAEEVICPYCKGRVRRPRRDVTLVETFQHHLDEMHPVAKPITVNDILERLGSRFRLPEEET